MRAFKDCLKIVWSGKQTQYSQPQDLVRSNSFEQKKVSPFGNGTARLMFCIHLYWNHSFWAFAAGILWKLNPMIFLQEYIQPNVLQVATTMILWKMITVFRSSSCNFSSPHPHMSSSSLVDIIFLRTFLL